MSPPGREPSLPDVARRQREQDLFVASLSRMALAAVKVVDRFAASFEKRKSPSLTLLDVALSRLELDGSVGGVRS